MLLPPTVNGFPALSVRLSIPWRGVWVAHVELGLELVELAATLVGPVILQLGELIFNGWVDDRGTGTFGGQAHIRIVGGHGGWDKEVVPLHFPNPAGALISTIIYAATAAEVLELPPIDPIPQLLTGSYGRCKGRASAIFGDRDWHVDPVTGVAMVIPWIPLPPDPLWTIVDYDIDQQRVTINSDSVILPGTIIADLRFGAKTYIARDIEQTFDRMGSHAEVWVCEKPASRLQSAFASAVRAFSDTAHLRMYKYRFVVPIAGQLALQAITEGAPDLNPIDQWTGLSGIKAELGGLASLFPATEIIVGFVDKEPFVVSYSPLAKPFAITVDATVLINLGAAPTSPLALATGVQGQIIALQAEILAIVAALTVQANAGAWLAPAAASTMAPALAAATAAATTALALSAALTPSKKVLSE